MTSDRAIFLLRQHKRTFQDVPEVVESTNKAIECVGAMEKYCLDHNCEEECWFYKNNVDCGH